MTESASASSEPAPPASVLRHPPFSMFLVTRIASSIAFQMLAVAVGWQVYTLTDSAYALGLIGLVQFLPVVLLTPIVGQVADRYDRRIVVGLCLAAESAAALGLALGTFGGWLGVEGIYALIVVLGSARAFESPTMQALLPNILPRALLPRATAWSTSANQTAQILGPALGGVLVVYGPAAVYATATVMFAVGVVLVALIRIERVVRPRVPITLESVLTGLHFIRHQRVIFGTLALDLFVVLLGGAVALLPIYAKDILEAGPAGLGLLRSAPAVGALSMSLILAQRPLKPPVGPTLFAAIITFGVATLVFALSTNLVLSLVALFIVGASDVVSVVIRFALVQLRTPDEMQGRVSAVNFLFIGTSNQLGEFRAGMTAGLFGTVPAAVLGGIGAIAVGLIWMRLYPELRQLYSLEGDAPDRKPRAA